MPRRAGATVCWGMVAAMGVATGTWAAQPPEVMRVEDSRRLSLDHDWRFMRGDVKDAATLEIDDSEWRHLDLPHDWAIEGPFDKSISPHCGALPYFGVAWYRKHFRVPSTAHGRHLAIEFDGAMSNAEVWLNGEKLGGRPYGYIGFAFDLDPTLRVGLGEDNVIAVRLAPKEGSSRWYPGAGIYRNVWLNITRDIHVARWGTYVRTPQVTPQEATVLVRTEVRSRRSVADTVTIDNVVVDPDGTEAGHATITVDIPAGETRTVEQSIVVRAPALWWPAQPTLHRLVTVIRDGDVEWDATTTPFGIRSVSYDKDHGFLLNGQPVKLKGVCLHHDLGPLGTAVNRRAIERELQILQGMGVNAIRTSHNPPAPEVLDLCDRLGIMVLDEAFDMWRKPKVPNGHAVFFDEWGETDLRDMLRRDRNHPSVVMWSIGNEVLEQADPDGWKIARDLTQICHEEDPTRPVTAGYNQMDNAIKNGLVAEVDIPGFNYKVRHYERVLHDHPDWWILGTETASCVSSRGVYHLPIEKYESHPSHQITSYDIIAPRWAYAPDPELDAQERIPRLLGELMWTGFDYLGEPTPYFDWRKPMSESEADWPARSSYFGAVDLAGFPKDRYYLYQSAWTTEPMVHILPHWNWQGHEGQKIPVMVYTNAADAELFLNGRSLGRKVRGVDLVTIPVGHSVNDEGTFKTKFRLEWEVSYEPGTLRAVAHDKDGHEVASAQVDTAGRPARVTLQPDREHIAADGDDLAFVTVRIEDAAGHLCPMADNLVRFEVVGAGDIAAVGNGNPATFEPFQAKERHAFNGKALLIVRSRRAYVGAIRIAALSEGLQGSRAVVMTGNPSGQEVQEPAP